jgi:YVTN family beta-propeller protein
MWIQGSYRWGRRVIITALVAVAGPLIYLGVHYSKPGRVENANGPEVPDYTEPTTVAFTKANRRAVRRFSLLVIVPVAFGIMTGAGTTRRRSSTSAGTRGPARRTRPREMFTRGTLAMALVLAASAAASPTATSLRVGRYPYRLAVSGNSLWASVYGAESVVRVNPRRGRITARFRVGGGPGSLVVAGHTIWIGNYVGRSIMQLDLVRRRVRRIRVGEQPIAVDAGGGAVWVADKSDGRVTKVSLKTGRVILHRSFRNELHEGLVVLPDGVWVSSEAGVVHKLDPKTGRTILTVRVGEDADYVTAGSGSLWVSCYRDDRLWRLDPATGKVLQTIPVGTGAQGMAVDGSTVWVANYDSNELLRVDTTAGLVVERIPTGPQPRGVVIAGGSVWVANSGGSTLTRVSES